MVIGRFENDQLTQELHDWNTGLLYKSNKDTGICRVSKLSDGEATELKDLFQVEGNPPYQWTGQVNLSSRYFYLKPTEANFECNCSYIETCQRH